MKTRYITIKQVNLYGNKDNFEEKLVKEFKYPIKKSEDGNLMLKMFISEDLPVRTMMMEILKNSNRVDKSFKYNLECLLTGINGCLYNEQLYYYLYNIKIEDLILTFSMDFRYTYTVYYK